ncbi:hypothetical protein ACL9RL_11540 [Plantibacter sp. Mn2098]|uniref:hypothetical protein n=1 Tax=Plantibacter sp. Mn2098 TaxID=3395266 RepID=UPI003BC70C65
MSNAVADGEDAGRDVSNEALVSRVQLIDDQALEQRAEAYVQVYEELRTRLEGSDSPRHSA